jgi:hypothetical protein
MAASTQRKRNGHPNLASMNDATINHSLFPYVTQYFILFRSKVAYDLTGNMGIGDGVPYLRSGRLV